MVLGNSAGGSGPERNTIRQCWAELMTEIIATQCEGISQRIIVRDIGAIVIAERVTPIRYSKAIHFPIIPLFVNGNPIMSNIFGVVQEKMMRIDRASLAIRH